MDKIAAYKIVLENHPLWTKEARVYGAQEPDVLTSAPFASRLDAVREYAKQKSLEDPTPYHTAALTGGAIGSGIGFGVSKLRGGSGLGGALVGGGTGGLLGLMASAGDRNVIEQMKKLQETGEYEDALAEMIARQGIQYGLAT